jgi:hypothetical protein
MNVNIRQEFNKRKTIDIFTSKTNPIKVYLPNLQLGIRLVCSFFAEQSFLLLWLLASVTK